MENNYTGFLKEQLGYTDEEMKVWLRNPRNTEGIEKMLTLLQKTIVIRVVESHGCVSLHKKGQEFYFDGPGNLLSKLNPKRICIYALSQMERLIFGLKNYFMRESIQTKCGLSVEGALMWALNVVDGVGSSLNLKLKIEN